MESRKKKTSDLGRLAIARWLSEEFSMPSKLSEQIMGQVAATYHLGSQLLTCPLEGGIELLWGGAYDV